MHKVVLLVACLAGKGHGRRVHTSNHQLRERASADSIAPAESTASALSPLKAVGMLVFALSPRSAFDVSGAHLPFNSPASASFSSVGMGRSGAAPQAIIGHINVPKNKKKNKNNQNQLVAKWTKATQILTGEFVGGYRIPKDMPRTNLPEVTFAGRSNVGKSSALNQLLCGSKKKVAVTSKTPGRTRLLNLFKMGDLCSVTDLPGYGFAKVSDGLMDKWKSGITAYFRHRQDLRGCVLLVDANVEPQPADAQLLDFLEEEKVTTVVVATKFDKVKKNDREKVLHRLWESLALPDGQPIPFSALTGEGKKEVWEKVREMCQEGGRFKELQLKTELEFDDDHDEEGEELMTMF
mmetsp:Transcript_36938/g.69046  ORF Transcript_36938/g.69046 Transcript_36938/m.69046 type:complete len:351 (+) Transcript_36938:63-1115(+)